MGIVDAFAAGAAAAQLSPVAGGISFDWTINVGNVLTIAALIGGGAWWLISFHYDLKSLRTEVTTVREVLTGLKDVLTKLGRHEEKFSAGEQRFNALEERMGRLEDELGDLRRGEGFKLPHFR